MAPPAIDQVVVHPLVLLSVVDHYNRVAKDTKKRVVGVILGESYKGRIDATNSFAGARRRAARTDLGVPVPACCARVGAEGLAGLASC